MTRAIARTGFACLALFAVAGTASAQLRVVNWNVTNYSSGRINEFQTAVYGVVPAPLALQGKSMSPDIFIGEEFLSQTAVNNFLSILNTAPGSPGDWAAAPFIDGPDTDSAFFYRTSKIDYKATVVVSLVTGSTSLPPRNTYRYDVVLKGYADLPATRLACYSAHMKSGSASSDQSRRLLEANKIRDNANGTDTNGAGTKLPAGWNFLFGADLNIQNSSQTAYQRLVQSESNNTGRFWDPINSPGTWNNNSAFRFIHTQDPADATGGMDDRLDQILVGTSLINGSGFEYIGNQSIPFSTSTWNDPNHSYRCWGNDGTSYNTTLTTAGNTMVGATIAQALVASAQGLGHLPVYLDFRVPAKVSSPTTLSFGTVNVGDAASVTLTVTNSGDVALWTAAGISNLNYSLAGSAGFSAPGGSFVEAAGGGSNSHTITIDTSTPGIKSGTVTINSDSPEQPARVVTITGEVVAAPSCPADFNNDGFVDFTDFDAFVSAFETDGPGADFNNDGFVDFTDFDAFVAAFETPC
ncbi:MAG: choice-of-anchor D domain-containing protein [Planctomycetota bacterium]|nr:choice-of-anchor D domain-containing protein [Planctomycetota bacterium]